ncbi:hypothetical protein GQ457_08G001570 [Hibiscus cannabinus]
MLIDVGMHDITSTGWVSIGTARQNRPLMSLSIGTDVLASVLAIRKYRYGPLVSIPSLNLEILESWLELEYRYPHPSTDTEVVKVVII